MSVDNLQSIILLLFFIAPGFVFTRTYTAYRPRYYREPTAFEQFVLAIVGSTVIHGAVLAIFALILLGYWWFTNQLLYQNIIIDFAALPTSYDLPTLSFSILIGILYLSISLILARRFGSFLGQGIPAARPHFWKFFLGADPPEPFLLWHTILQIEALEQELIPPYLKIKMRSGEYFEGDLYRLRLVGDEENTVELALSNVYYSPLLDKDNLPASSDLSPLTEQIILLKSTDILWLTRNDIPR